MCRYLPVRKRCFKKESWKLNPASFFGLVIINAQWSGTIKNNEYSSSNHRDVFHKMSKLILGHLWIGNCPEVMHN